MNVEHLLNIFTSIDMNSGSVWDACANFIMHLYWHKKRLVSLGPKIEALPDHHFFKPGCLFKLSILYSSVGNQIERKRLLSHALKLWKERGDEFGVATTSRDLGDTNRRLQLYQEGTRLIKEALGTFERLKDTAGQAQCLFFLTTSLLEDQQLDAAHQ